MTIQTRSLSCLRSGPLKALLFTVLSTLVLSNHAAAQGKVRIVVSTDWEGRSIEPDNLQAFTVFRNDYPAIPVQHFLNAAYYTKDAADKQKITNDMRSVIRAGDEHGLHIHAWRSLVQASGVTWKTDPAFKGAIDLEKCTPDCGHDVNITAYSEEELRKIIRFSIKTLTAQGFDRAKSFRAGAWQADRKVLRALAAEGITFDSSATDAEFLKERWGKTLLYPVTKKIWPATLVTSQPEWIDLGAGRKILELPNNGCLADYVTGESILASFKANADLLKANPSKDVYLSIGFHQETALKYLPNLRKGIDLIQAHATEQKIPIEFVVPPLGI